MKANILNKKGLVTELEAFSECIEKDSQKVFINRLHHLILRLKRFENRVKKESSDV